MIERRWQILGLLFLARTAMGFQFQSIASAAPFLIADLHVGYASIGTLIGFYMLPGVLIAFPGGLLSRRFGDKAVCSAGLALMIAGGILLGFSVGTGTAFAGRLLSGTGGVLFNLVLTKMATDWFAGREIVLAMSIILASWPFGIAAGLLLQPPLAAAEGWRWVMHGSAALCAVALLLIAAGYRQPKAAAVPGGALAVPPLRQLWPTAVAGVMWGNINLALVLFFSFGPAAMAGLGMPTATAAGWTGAALWVVMVSVPLGGLAVQRSGRPDAAIALFSVLGGAALALLPTGVGPAVMAAAFAVTMGPPAGAILALPSRVLSPEHRAGGLGVFLTIYYAIQAFGPALAGALREALGTPAAAIWLAAAAMTANAGLLACYLAFARRNRSNAVRVASET